MKESCLKGCFCSKESVVINKVILNLIQDLRRLSVHLVNSVRGRFQIKFGMTFLFNNGGFTLIELLVVVLIIGILAAVALPQYQMAVWKSRFSTVKALTNSLAQAEEIYYLTNAGYTTDTSDLDIDVPAPDNTSISSQYGDYYYPWGYCQIELITDKVQKVACRLNKDGSDFLGYTQYLNHSPRVPGQKTCVAYHKSGETNTFQHRLCKNETGQQERDTDLSSNTLSTFLY